MWKMWMLAINQIRILADALLRKFKLEKLGFQKRQGENAVSMTPFVLIFLCSATEKLFFPEDMVNVPRDEIL